MEENKIPQTGELFADEFIKVNTKPVLDGVVDLILSSSTRNINDIYKELQNGDYNLRTPFFATEALLPRAQAYFDNMSEQVREDLKDAGVSADTIHAVLLDYCGILSGITKFTATPKQMLEAIGKYKPSRAYLLDRYGVYFGLFLSYNRYLKVLGEYQEKVIFGDPTTDDKVNRRAFIDEERLPFDASAIDWLVDIGVILPEHFIGIEPQTVVNFLSWTKGLGLVGLYAMYVFIAKYILHATAEELADIQPPDVDIVEIPNIQEFALSYADITYKKLNADAKKFSNIYEAKKTEEQERAREELKSWDRYDRPTVALHETPNLICSRPVEVVPGGNLSLGRVPVQQAIDDFIKISGDKYGNITPHTVHKVVETINYLTNFHNPDANGGYNIPTTINQFCAYAGFSKPNQEQQRALYGALLAISDIYFVVNRPYKNSKYTDHKGTQRRRKTGGLTATRLVSVDTELNDFGGARGIIIKIDPFISKDRKTVLKGSQFKTLRSSSEGNSSKTMFWNILITRSHKKEEDIISDVFMYEERLNTASTPEDLARAKKYIRGHKAEHRRKVAAWFEEYKNNGILKDYQYKAESKSYEWVRVKK